VLGAIPPGAWHRICGVNLVVPHWHIVGDAPIPHVSGLYRFRTLTEFTADVEFFLRHYRPVTEEEVIAHLHEGYPIPSRSVLLTFDDGFREMYDVVAPLLRAKGVPAVFFLIASAVDNQRLCHPQKASLLLNHLEGSQSAAVTQELHRLLTEAGVPLDVSLPGRIRSVTWQQRGVLDHLARVLGCDFDGYLQVHRPYVTTDQVRSLIRQGFSAGAHSVDHPDFRELSATEKAYQVLDSVRWVSETIGVDCRSFAFPYRDTGIPLTFFDEVFAKSGLKLSFGTGGILTHPFRFNLERFSMERTDLTARQVLGIQFARRLRRSQLVARNAI